MIAPFPDHGLLLLFIVNNGVDQLCSCFGCYVGFLIYNLFFYFIFFFPFVLHVGMFPLFLYLKYKIHFGNTNYITINTLRVSCVWPINVKICRRNHAIS